MKGLLRDLADIGAILEDDHFVYTSGRHGQAYVDKDRIYTHPLLANQVTLEMASYFVQDGIEAVVGPEKGGIILSQLVAHHLSNDQTGHEALAFYAEKEDGGFVLKRGGAAERINGLRVLVVEDNLTTGGSVKKVVDLVRTLGGNVIGVCAIVNRGDVKADDIGNPPKFVALVKVSMESWAANECPLCAQGTPVRTDLGKEKEFLLGKGGP